MSYCAPSICDPIGEWKLSRKTYYNVLGATPVKEIESFRLGLMDVSLMRTSLACGGKQSNASHERLRYATTTVDLLKQTKENLAALTSKLL